jgi:C_GCAxxG_C_C family probable redox protein
MIMHSEKAVKTFVSGQNCCQAVISAYAVEYKLDTELAEKIGLGFGGGIALTRDICGAATGMVMVLGLKFADKLDKFKFYEMIQKSLKEFEKQAGNLNCEDLTHSSYGEKLPPEHKQTCSKYIKMACNIIDGVKVNI